MYWNRLPTLLLDRIEVARGGASPHYGSSALGGTIQLFSRDPAPAFHARARAGELGVRDSEVLDPNRSGDFGFREAYVVPRHSIDSPCESSIRSVHFPADVMLDSLGRYYAAEKILATKFECKHKSVCSNGNPNFVGPASAFVSTGYERRELPRLLILSPDSGRREEPVLPLDARKWEDCRDIMSSPPYTKNKHWFRTHELAWYILRRFDPQLVLEDVNKYFAHANAAKCCENWDGGAQARNILFEKCRPYFSRELEILSPDILVTQGKKAESAIRHSPVSYEILDIEGYSSRRTASDTAPKLDDAWYRKYASPKYLRRLRNLEGHSGHDVFWLHTCHPTPRGRTAFWGQIDLDKKKPQGHPERCRGWNRYGDIIADWWKQEYRDLKL